MKRLLTMLFWVCVFMGSITACQKKSDSFSSAESPELVQQRQLEKQILQLQYQLEIATHQLVSLRSEQSARVSVIEKQLASLEEQTKLLTQHLKMPLQTTATSLSLPTIVVANAAAGTAKETPVSEKASTVSKDVSSTSNRIGQGMMWIVALIAVAILIKVFITCWCVNDESALAHSHNLKDDSGEDEGPLEVFCQTYVEHQKHEADSGCWETDTRTSVSPDPVDPPPSTKEPNP